MKVLVTGSNGQLGKELQKAAKHFPQLSFIYTDIGELDITKRDEVLSFMERYQPQFIINAAAYTAVDKAEDEPLQAELLNAVATGNLVTGAFSVNAHLLHVSTDYVFDGKKKTPYLETDPINPLSVYGATKVEGEQAVLSYKWGMVIRTAWLYSAGGNNFLQTILRLGKERQELRVVNDQFGAPTYAADLASAILQVTAQVAAQPKHFINGIYHYTNAGMCSWFDFARHIIKLAGLATCVRPCCSEEYPTKAHRPAYSVLGTDRIRQTYGLVIPSWEDGLKRCFKEMNNC
jgi:dTDP-4-dehydrorhamnose reductase